MNRITQCLHGKGTVSEMMAVSESENTNKFLAYNTIYRPVIFWNLTGKCNLSCEHCYNSSGPNQTSESELTTSEAIGFIDDCNDLGVPVILLSGGEPLMREDIWYLAEHAHKLGIKTALSSNGTLITRIIAEKIKSAGIGYVGISLDGATAATHDQFRNCPGTFEQVIRAFSVCRDSGIRFGIRVTLTKKNHHELGDLIDLALRIGACRFCVYWLVPSGRGTDTYQEIQLSEDELLSALNLVQKYAKSVDPSVMEFLTVDGPQDAIHLLQSMEQEGEEDLPEARELIASMKGGCSAGIRVANISPSGDVYPCQFAQIPEFFIGSVRKQQFSRLWNDPDNPVLLRFRNKNQTLKGKCASCSFLDLCGGGCRIRAYQMEKDFSAPDPFCFIKS